MIAKPPVAGWRRHLCILGLCVLFGGLTWVRADETAMVHIRARSQLRLREGERGRAKDGLHLSVSVQLDDNQPSDDNEERADRSFAGQRVRLELVDEAGPARHELVFTDASGAATQRFTRLLPGRYRLTAQYDGDDERDRSATFIDIDLDRRPAEIILEAPISIGLHDPLPVKLTLRTSGGPLAGLVTLSIGDRPRQAIEVGNSVHLERIMLSPPPQPGSHYKLAARFAGDEEFSPALAEHDLLITTQAHLALEAEVTSRPSRFESASEGAEVPQGGRLILRGTAFDETGPLPGETIDLEVDSGGIKQHLGSTLSDSYGRYELVLPKLQLRVGPAFLIGQVTPRRHHILPGHSAELPLTVLPPEPVSLLYFVLPLLFTGLILTSLLAARALRPRIASWLAALREKRARRATAGVTDAAAPRTPPRISLPATGEAGVKLGSQKSSLTFFRTVDTTIEGGVHDAVFGPPIADASLELMLAGAGRATRTDDEGRFVLSQLPAGRHTICVRAPGYLDEEFVASVPHRGELRGITVRLMPVRARILVEWQRVAELFYGQKTELAAKTPRELFVEAQAQRAGQKPVASGAPFSDLTHLQRLTTLVEQGYYSKQLCTTEMLDEAIKLAAALCLPTPGAAAMSPPSVGASGDREIRAPGAPRPLESR